MAVSKSFTRMATIAICFNQAIASDNGTKTKKINTNYFPTASAETCSWSLALGTKRMPDNDCRGIGESWYYLQNALGVYNSLAHASGVDEASYKSDTFCLMKDCEKVSMVSASGENLSSGQTLFIRCKGFGSSPTDVPRSAMIAMHHEEIIAIQDTAVDVFT